MLCSWYPGFISLCDFSFLSVSFALFQLVSFLFLENRKTYTHCHPSSLAVVCSNASRSCICSRLVWKWMLWKSDSEHRSGIPFTASSFPTCLYPSWNNSCHSFYSICFFSAYSLILSVAWYLLDAGNSSITCPCSWCLGKYLLNGCPKKIPLLVRYI